MKVEDILKAINLASYEHSDDDYIEIKMSDLKTLRSEVLSRKNDIRVKSLEGDIRQLLSEIKMHRKEIQELRQKLLKTETELNISRIHKMNKLEMYA